jgi:hypothetical protein
MMANVPTRRVDAQRCIILIIALGGVGKFILLSAQTGFPGFGWSQGLRWWLSMPRLLGRSHRVKM